MKENFNKDLLQVALKKVKESYDGKEIPVGDEILVVFDDCSLLYTMTLNEKKEKHLKIAVSLDKPIVVEGVLFK